MKLLLRFTALIVSVSAIVCLALAGIVVALVGTEGGQEFVRRQTVEAVDKAIGPDFVAQLGRWSLELQPDGLLAVTWNDVTFRRKGRPDNATTVERMALGLRLAPLLSGKLAFGRLEVQGARLDIGSLDDGRSARLPRKGVKADLSIAKAAASTIVALEQRLASFGSLDFETFFLSDIDIDGLPETMGKPGSLLIEFAEFHRSSTGALDFFSGLSVASLPLSISGSASFDVHSGRLSSVNLRTASFDLARVFPPGLATDLKDERPFGTDADARIALAISRSAVDNRLEAQADVTADAGALQFGNQHARLEGANIVVHYAEGEEQVQLLPSRFRFDGLDFTVQGLVDARATGTESKAGQLRFQIGSSDVRSSVPGREHGAVVQTATVSAKGYFDPALHELRLSRMELQTPSGNVLGSAKFGYGSPTALTSLRLVTKSLSSRSLKAFWPINMAGKVRAWTLAHSGDEGRILAGYLAIDLRHERLSAALHPDTILSPGEFRMGARFEDASLQLDRHIPPFRSFSGSISTLGGRTAIRIDKAVARTSADFELKRSELVLTKVANARPSLLEVTASLNVATTVASLIEVGKAVNTELAVQTVITPEAAHGVVALKANASLLLGEEVPASKFLRSWNVAAEFSDATFDQPIEGRMLTAANGSVTLSPGSAVGELSGKVDGVPADVQFTLPFGGGSDVSRTFAVDLALTAAKAAEIAPVLKGVLRGSMQARITETAGIRHAVVDLGEASIDLPMVAWNKGKGVPAKLSFSIEPAGLQTAFRDLRLDGEGFSASGTALANASGLQSAALQDISLNPGDDIALSIERAGNGYSVSIKGEQLDVRPILKDLRTTIGQKRSSAGVGGETLDVSVAIARLNGFDERTLSDFALNYASDRGETAALAISGSTGDKGAVSADLSPRANGRAIEVKVGDLGALAKFTGLYANMDGGKADLELFGSSKKGYRGTFRLEDFSLVNEPRLSRIVGTSKEQSSLSQAVGKDLSTERASFDQAIATVSFNDGGLQVEGGIVRGSLFGSSFAGTLYDRNSKIDLSGSFMPAYGINRVFGAIPLVGRILGNGNEGGLIGITYRLFGAFDRPQLSVNPISAIAPGIFRQIFAYQ